MATVEQTTAQLEKAKRVLKKYFGYDTFRPMQEEVIETIFSGRDSLVLMPTGGGKSLCFQIPSIVSAGIAVVVSPLIALMKDQVENLLSAGIPAAYLNSSQSAADQQRIENELFEGKLKLLYVSPEKMVSAGFISMLRNLEISIFAIDEAHCISSWGHDFRPEYAQMSFLPQQFPQIPIVALTATADRLTRRDIIEKLNLRNPAVFISSFDRPNLSLEVRSGQKRIEQIEHFLRIRKNQAGIVYCLSRKSTEDIAEKLRERGYKAQAYHAQLPNAQRAKVQEDFLRDDVQIVCATIAFGMGIDKPNIRWVIHYNLPKNLESYYQEIGRAGRDGTNADTLLFYSMQDVMTYRDMLGQNEAGNQEIQLAKLDRMMQYADAQICRRRILLNYFSEYLSENCGNCDVCKNPPKYFDGTKPAQMALSAVTRLQQSVSMTVLVDVLRGSARQEIVSNGYDQIKTYGAGRAFTQSDWLSYIWQLIQSGYLEIAYEDGHKLRLTPSSKSVLFDGKSVQLLRPVSLQDRKIAAERDTASRLQRDTEPRLRSRNELFEALRELRRELAMSAGVPPYVVFSESSLEEMAAQMPSNEAEMLQISGVGEVRFESYGKAFLNKIAIFLKENPLFEVQKEQNKAIFIAQKTEKQEKTAKKPKSTAEKVPKNSSHQITLDLHLQGHPIDEIAKQRTLARATVISHLLALYEAGEKVDFNEIVSQFELIQITEAAALMGGVETPLRDLYDHFGTQIGYDKLRFAMSFYKKNK